MMLFLRCQVEDFAWKKWGSPEALDAEYERREKDKKRKKTKKFEQSLNELRRRTAESVWQRRQDEGAEALASLLRHWHNRKGLGTHHHVTV